MYRGCVGLVLAAMLGLGCATGQRTAAGAEAGEPEEEPIESFAERAVSALREAGAPAEMHYEPWGYLLWWRDAEGEVRRVWLESYYTDYLRLPSGERSAVLARLALLAQEPRVPRVLGAEQRHKLLPRLRPRELLERQAQTPAGGAGQPVRTAWRAFGGFLAVGLVYEGEHTAPNELNRVLHDVSWEDLERWGLSFDEALALAQENLRTRSREPLGVVQPGLCEAPWADELTASRILVEGLVDTCAVRGEPVALLANHRSLVITGSEDEAGLMKAASLAAQQIDEPRALDGRLLRRTARGWEPYLPDALCEAWPRLRMLELYSLQRDHDRQSAWLEARREQRGEGPYAAGYSTLPGPEERPFTFTTWVKGAELLLPRAEVVFFVDPDTYGEDAPLVGARWEEVVEAAGGLLEPTDLYPERYRTTGFPAPELLQRWELSHPSVLLETLEDGS